MSVPDHRGLAAKRQGGGSGRRIRRDGFADGIRPTRVGNVTVEGDHDFGDSVHAYVALAFDYGDEERRSGHKRVGERPEIERSGEVGSGPGATSARTAAGWHNATVAASDTTTGSSGSEEIALHLRRWRNWQTH